MQIEVSKIVSLLEDCIESSRAKNNYDNYVDPSLRELVDSRTLVLKIETLIQLLKSLENSILAPVAQR